MDGLDLLGKESDRDKGEAGLEDLACFLLLLFRLLLLV
jgi:hypothetical protein